MMQLETATGRIIQIPGEEENPDHVIERIEKESEESEDEDQEATELPFACNLCKRRFSRKLHLNNHMERHHGIKYVFTEKGRKVKLVRIPEGFQIVAGEKLDPCVENLLATIDKDQIHSIIGVEEIDEPEQNNGSSGNNNNNNSNNLSDEEGEDCGRLADLLNGKTEGQFGCGFLFEKINYKAYQVTVEKGEAPFAVFYPPNQTTDQVYLFKIVPAGEKQHLFLRATKKDIRSAAVAKKDGENYSIPLVAALKISEEMENPTISVEPLPAEKPTKVELMSFEDFVGYARLCQGNGVKNLADSIEISPSPSRAPIIVDAAPKKRRKFERRTRGAILKAESKMGATDSFSPDTPVVKARKVPKKERDTKIQKVRRNLNKDFEDEVDEDDDDDEQKDASYFPRTRIKTGDSEPEQKLKEGRKRGRPRGRPPGTKNRKKKDSPESLDTC